VTAPTARKPPPGVWIAAALLAAALLFVLASLDRNPMFAAATSGFRLNLDRLSQTPSDATHVVAIGSSKSMFALDFDDAFAARLDGHGRRVVFHRITAGGAEFADLQPALAAVAQHPPKVLLLESELLLFDRGDALTLEGAIQAARKNATLLVALLMRGRVGGSAAANRGREHWTLPSVCSARHDAESQRAYAEYARHWRPTREAERTAYLGYLHAMQAAGTRIVLLELPRSPAADEAIPDAIKQEGARLRAELAQREGFPFWDPGVLPTDVYCDQMHMNARGREAYSDWLARRLNALLGGRAGV
jgi:hypothetical protein